MNEGEKAMKIFKEKTIDPMTEFIKNLNKENMMEEWKELKINNLPADILTGDYEFEHTEFLTTHIDPKPGRFYPNKMERWELITIMCKSFNTYRYRKPEPKAPTYKERAIESLSLATGLSNVKAKNLIEAIVSAYEEETP